MTAKPVGKEGLACFLCLLALALTLWGRYLDTPFSRVLGFADYISNENGRIAENHLHYGLSETRGDQIRNLEPAPPAEWIHYNNHPATLDVLTAGVLAVTGSRAPWAQRLLSFLATLASLILVGALARHAGSSPWIARSLFLILPITLIHGLNLSYEPLALLWMLALLLLWDRGWRWGLLPLLWLGGLIDFPVLYLGPWFALQGLWEARHRSAWAPALLQTGALALTCLASLGTHLLHVAWTMGGIRANSGQSWWDHILRSLQARGNEPALLDFLSAQAGFFVASFTLPVLVVALLSFLPWPSKEFRLARGRGPGLAALAFLFAGSLHLFLFRAHAMVHDFWLAYYAPFFALAGAAFLQRLPRPASLFVLVLASILGLGQARGLWKERASVPVRSVAADLSSLFDADVVLHSLLAPPGWALETWRGHPVLDASDLLQQPFAAYLDRLGSLGYLGRPQRLFVPVAALEESWARDLDQLVLPGARHEDRRGRERADVEPLYRIYDLGPFLLDPGRSPFLMDKGRLLPDADQRITAEERLALIDRARMFLVLRLFAPGSRISYLDGREGSYENFLGRQIRSAGAEGLRSDKILVAWPGTDWATRLRARHGAAVRRVAIRACGQPASVWIWQADS